MTRTTIPILAALVAVSVAVPPGRANECASGAATSAVEGVPRLPAEGGPRRWLGAPGGELALREAPSVDAAVLDRVAGDTVLVNLGCANVRESVWCEVRPLRRGREGHVPAERLRPACGPDGIVPRGLDDSASRAKRGDFDARGEIVCAQERGQTPFGCAASVARGTGGDATVVARFPNGFERTLRFVHGEFVSASATMSGTGTDVDWRRHDGRHLLRVDDQRYELDDAFVFGR